jgi:hypothetical protein
MSGMVAFDFAGENVPAERSANYHRDFVTWVVGHCLTEIDQSFQRYLSDVVDTKRHLSLLRKGRSHPYKHHTQGNTPDLLKLASDELKIGWKRDGIVISSFASLTSARNCIAHDGGIVTSQRAHPSQALIVLWQGIDITLGGVPVNLDQQIRLQRDDVGKQISERFVKRCKVFPINSRVQFAKFEMNEVIAHFLHTGDFVQTSFKNYVMENK